MPSSRKTSTEHAIRNLYDRAETHERAVRFGFVVKSIPIVFVALYALYVVALDPSGLIRPNATIAMVALAALALVFAFWRSDLLRTAAVYAS